MSLLIQLEQKWIGGSPFSYGILEKATWDTIKYSPESFMGSINFTLPNTPTRSYHIGFQWIPELVKMAQKEDSEMMVETMAPLVNIILPSIKPASEILKETKPVTIGSYTFRVLKDNEYSGTSKILNEGTVEMYDSNTIKEAIFKVPLHPYNPKKDNIFLNMLHDMLSESYFLEHKIPIQSATVWNDGIPALYMEGERLKGTLFMVVTYDSNHRYVHLVERLHTSPISKEVVRDAIQYIDTKGEGNKLGVRYGLGLPAGKSAK